MTLAAAGTVQSAVSSKTRYLVAGAGTGASKTAAAEKFGTEIIDEKRLEELLCGTDCGRADAETPAPPPPRAQAQTLVQSEFPM